MVLARCTHVRLADGSKVPLTDALRRIITTSFIDYGTGSQTLRCLGLATIDSPPSLGEILPKVEATTDVKELVHFEKNMTFVGVVGMLDPPRQEVKVGVCVGGVDF